MDDYTLPEKDSLETRLLDRIDALEAINAEMLAALEDALEFIKPFSSFIGQEGVTEKKIKAAIAKAKG